MLGPAPAQKRAPELIRHLISFLFPSPCLAACRSRAFYSPQLQPRRAPGQLPAVAPLARCQQPRPGRGTDTVPGVPAAVQARGEGGLRRKADN